MYRVLWLILVCLATASCSGNEVVLPPLRNTSGSTTLVVQQTGSAPRYIEGSLSFLRLEDLDGTVVFEGRWRGTYLQQQVEPGSYVLRHWLRSCSGNCGELHAPSDRCSREVRVDEGTTTRTMVHLRSKGNCSISL